MRREDIPTIPSRIEYAVNPLQDPIVVSSLQRNAAFEAIFRDADAGLPPPEDLKSRVAEDRLQLLTIFILSDFASRIVYCRIFTGIHT